MTTNNKILIKDQEKRNLVSCQKKLSNPFLTNRTILDCRFSMSSQARITNTEQCDLLIKCQCTYEIRSV